MRSQSRLEMTTSAVKNTMQQLFSKTGAHNRSQMVRILLESYRTLIRIPQTINQAAAFGPTEESARETVFVASPKVASPVIDVSCI